MNAVGLGARVLLALVFAVAAVGKLADKPGTRDALRQFHVPESTLAFGSVALPVAELLTATALLVQPSARGGAIATLVLLALFIGGIAAAMIRGESPDCRCFGQVHSAPAGRSTLIRNALLATPAVFVLAHGPGTSLNSWLSSRSTADVVALIASVAAVALTAFGLQLMVQNRRLSRDLSRIRDATRDIPPGPPIGVPAPRFSLPDTDGNSVALDKLLALGRPVAMVFVTPHCGSCEIMLPTLASWQRRLSDRITIVITGKGTARELRAVSEQYGLRNLVVDEESEVFDAYRVASAPSAVIVTADGRVGSSMHSTSPIVEALIRRTLADLKVQPPDRDNGREPARDAGTLEVVRWGVPARR